jgi:hypothetical protein
MGMKSHSNELNGLVGYEIEIGIMIPVITSLGQVLVSKNKGNGTWRNGSNDDHIFVEYTGVIMILQNTLLIIDRRGVSIMSVSFSDRRVTHLRVHRN